MLSLDMHLLVSYQPVDQALLLQRKVWPASDGIRFMEEADIKDEFLKIVERHFSILRIAARGIECRCPAKLTRLFTLAPDFTDTTHSSTALTRASWINGTESLGVASCRYI